jgi:hypothetical protein
MEGTTELEVELRQLSDQFNDVRIIARRLRRVEKVKPKVCEELTRIHDDLLEVLSDLEDESLRDELP